MPYALEALRRRIDRRWFNWRCRRVFDTPPVMCDPESKVIIVSQIYSPDMTMYLLAAKSLARYVRPHEFLIVDDGLTRQDRNALEVHLGHVRFVRTRDVPTPATPRGGCWERLLSLSAENCENYVIQLDSDTLTISPPHEVMECIARDRTFTLGTPTGRHLVSANEASAYAEQHIYDHVQSHCERVLHRMQDAPRLKYVRGCAGFTGFARGELPLSGIESFARELAHMIGADRFAQWGSEQVTSNLMAANAPDALVLPVETYPFWKPGLAIDRLALIHFFGTYRFLGGMYLRQSLRVIDQLGSS
ncbi:MAG: hypothetical protein J0L57_01505 [Burkholderiales bacterium]|nr:hypothetical protein [Burkholderiales bacterium]